MKINFVGQKNKQLYFNDLAIGDCFYNASGRGRGTLYQKIAGGYTDLDVTSPQMLELSTGLVWGATTSPVEKVEVEINVVTTALSTTTTPHKPLRKRSLSSYRF